MRITIDMPEQFAYATEIPVLISHINSGQHLANEHLVALLNEARVRFLAERGISEGNHQGRVIVNANLMVNYRSEVRYGETLRVELAVVDVHRVGYDMVYRVTAERGQRPVAEARTSHVMIDPQTRRASAVPSALLSQLGYTSD